MRQGSLGATVGRAARALALLVALASPCASGAAGGLFPLDAVPGAADPIDPSQVAAARALGEADAALARGDLAAAANALGRARASAAIADYTALFEARLLLARGRPDAAAEAARRGCAAAADSPVGSAFAQLLGDALLARGDEAGAREAWKLALSREDLAPERREALQLSLLESHRRTGTLQDAIARNELEIAPAGEDPDAAELLRARLRSPAANLEHADELMALGHRATAIDLYDAALGGELTPAQRRRAVLERGHAQFGLRRYPDARASFALLLPEPEPRFWHARATARSGNTGASIALFEAIAASRDPEYGSWALYLAGTLLEDRGEQERALAHYERVARVEGASARARDALWRLGWTAYRQRELDKARAFFRDLASRSEGLDRLRPEYWSARAAEDAGHGDTAARELAHLAREYPFSYYGWRAAERLSQVPAKAAPARAGGDEPPRRLERGSPAIDAEQMLRVELLLEAGLSDFAESELAAFSDRARALDDRKAVATLYARIGDYHNAQRLVVDAYAEPLSRGIQPGQEALWWLAWPPAYRELVLEALPENARVDPALVWAIMREESSYRPLVTSSAGARGLLQIMPSTGEHVARKAGIRDFDADDLYTPRVNIHLGSAYLAELFRRFPDRPSAAIGGYNAGPTAVSGWLRGDDASREDDAWVEDIPYDQTRAYVKRVLRSLHVYRTFYAVPAPDA